MATTTPNYGWTVPTSTDLVKDGATAIETLGDAIDASMNTALGTKKAGMVLLNTTSFSGVASFSFPNNTLSATYDYYRIVVNITSGNAFLAWRARSAGSDNSSSNYMWVRGFYNSNSTPGTSFAGSGGLTTWGYLGSMNGSGIVNAELVGLFATQKAQVVSHATQEDGATGIGHNFLSSGMNITTSYDSLSLISTSGNISGKASIYGYNL
jgi:hypothetical protein